MSRVCQTPETTSAPQGGARRELISIVVISYNRSAALLNSLKSVAQLEAGGLFDTELVVVDNASTDDTPQVVKKFAAECQLPLRYVVEPQAGIPFARNRGVRESRGDWVCFFDDDQTAQPDWVLKLFQAARDHGVKCVGGARDLVIEKGLPAPRTELGRFLIGETPQSLPPFDYHRHCLPNTGNVLLHKSVFDQIGGFDERALEGGDDTDFFDRLIKAGIRARFTPDSLVHHHIPANRVSQDYLYWVAKRLGVIIARRDLTDGAFRFAASLLARVGQMALVHVPRLAAYKLLGNQDRAFDARCRIERVKGFVVLARHAMTPKRWRGDRVFSQAHHRDSSQVGAAKPAGGST